MKGEIYKELEDRGWLPDCIDYFHRIRMYEHRSFSFYNIALLFLQRPFLTEFHTKTQWEHRNRYIKPDANPLITITRNGPASLVYERNDTCSASGEKEKSAEELKKSIYGRKEYNAIADDCLPGFIATLEKMGIYYWERRAGERLMGHAQLMEHPVKFWGKTSKGETKEIWSHYAIVVNSIDTPVQKAKTILHEVGHILCGHLGIDKENTLTHVFNREHEDLSLSTVEIEAEKTCDMLCRMLGYQNDSSSYIEHYRSKEPNANICLEAIIYAAETFFNAFDSLNRQ